MTRLRRLFSRLHLSSLEPEGYEGRADTVDAMVASRYASGDPSGGLPPGIPSNSPGIPPKYIDAYDEGRPRH